MNGLEEAIASVPLWFRAVLGLGLTCGAIQKLMYDWFTGDFRGPE